MPHDANGTLAADAIPARQIREVRNTAFPLDARDRWVTISHWYDPKDIFPHVPRPDDVRQSAIGDCFLLAALHTAIQVDPALIEGMMRDLRGGWVVVRLYDNGTPVYYKVQKDYLANDGLAIARHGAPWVYMVEKAFAHHRLRNHYQCTPLVWDARTNTWSKGARREARTYREALSGGQPHEVFPVLTGGEGRVEDIEAERPTSGPGGTLLSIIRIGMDDYIDLNEQQKTALREVFGRFTGPQVVDLVRNNTPQKRVALVTQLFPGGGADYEKIVRAESLATFFDTHYAALQPATRAAIDGWIAGHFPGKRGTGSYTLAQTALYDRIRTAIQGRQMVVLSTASTLGRSPGSPGTSGEDKVKGLAGPHAYQVISVATRAHLRYVKLRNPWLHYGRRYVDKTLANGQQVLSATDDPGGVFEVELSDITSASSSCTWA